MKRAYSILIIAGIIAVICGCGGSGSPEPPKPTADLFPLTQGNSWTYYVEVYSGANSAQVRPMREGRQRRSTGFFNLGSLVSTSQSDQPSVGELYMTSNGEVPSETSGWYEVGRALNGDSRAPRYMKHDEEGLLVPTDDSYFEDGKLIVVDPYYRIRTPLEAGTQWEHEFVDPETDQPYITTFRIVAVGASKTVQGRTYENCVRTEEIDEIPGNRRRLVTWFAPGVGMVLSEEYRNGDLFGMMELYSYNVSAD